MQNTIKFEDYKNLIYKEAWKYSRMYNKELGDLISEGYIIFTEVVEKYDESRGVKFSTYLQFCLRKLIDYCKKEHNYQIKHAEISPELQTQLPDTRQTMVNELEEIFHVLSEDAKILVDGILEGVFHVVNPIRQTSPGFYYMMDRAKQLMNWNRTKTEKVFNEVAIQWGKLT